MTTGQTASRRARQMPNLFDKLMKAFGTLGPSIEPGHQSAVYMQLSDGLNRAKDGGAGSFDITLRDHAFDADQIQQVTLVISNCLSAGWGVVQVERIDRSTTYCWRVFKKRRAPRKRHQPAPKARMQAAAKPPPNP